MGRVKGCLNKSCKEYHKKYYKESDEYCVKCGSKLEFICKHPKCFKQIPANPKEKYCQLHLAELQDKKEKRKKRAQKIGGGILATIGTGVAIGIKKVCDNIPKK